MSGSTLGLISSGPQGDVEAQARRAELVPSTTGEVLGGALASAFAESPGPRMARIARRGYMDRGDGTYQPLNAIDELAGPRFDDLTGEHISELPPSPMVPLDVLRRDYAIPGVLDFDKDTPQSVAQSLYEHKKAQLEQQSAVERATSVAMQGGVARFLASAIGSLADPVNLAAMFVPGLNEVAASRVLGVAGATALERAAIRGVAGATQGAAGMVALEPLNYALSKQERDDWSMVGALANVALGTVAGAGLHSGIGALVERTRGLPDWAPVAERLRTAPPEVQEAMVRHAVAQQAAGEPVNAAALLDLADNLRGVEDLQRLVRAQQRLDAEALGVASDVRIARERAAEPNTPAAAAERHRAALTALREEAAGLDADMAALAERVRRSGLDEESAARLAAVEQELAGTIPAARRRALAAEQALLLEGRGALDEPRGLEGGRDAAEVQGLRTAAQRTRAEIERVTQALEATQAKAEEIATRRAALAEQAGDTERTAMRRQDVLQATLDANAARAVRQLAGALDARLSARDAQELGRAVVRGELTVQEAAAAIQRLKTDNVPITPETLSGRPTIATLLDVVDRQTRELGASTQRALADLTPRPPNPEAHLPPHVPQADAPPPEPQPRGEPTAVQKEIAQLDRSTAAWDRLIAAREAAAENKTLGNRVAEFDKLANEAGEADAATFQAAITCLMKGAA